MGVRSVNVTLKTHSFSFTRAWGWRGAVGAWVSSTWGSGIKEMVKALGWLGGLEVTEGGSPLLAGGLIVWDGQGCAGW